MRTTSVFLVAAALATAASVHAQSFGPSPDVLQKAQADAMKPLAWMDGRWQGAAWTILPTGKHEIIQTERIGPFLDGSVKVMEGKCFEKDGRPSNFNAFGIVSFDPASKKYTLHSYAQGRAGDFPFEPTATGYVWSIPAGPQMTLRYTAVLHEGTWTETGEMTRAGAPPVKVFEMNLHRVGDSDWPMAGQATAPK